MTALRHAVLAAAIAGLLAAPASAATWSEPAPLAGGSIFVWSSVGAALVYGADGRGLAWWPAAQDPLAVHVRSAVRAPGGAWRAADALGAGVMPALAPYARSRIIALEFRETPAGSTDGLYVRFGTLGERLGAPRRLSRAAYSDVALAASVRGAAAAVAATGRSGATTIRASYRRVGGSFPAVRTISRAWARFPAVAVAEDGTALVAWWRKYGRQGRRLIEARFHSPRSGWGRVQRIADLRASEPRLSVAAARGRFAVAWASADVSSGGEDEGTLIGAALRGRDSGWRVRPIEDRPAGAHFGGGGARVVIDRAGRATVVWGGQNPVGTPRVRAARLRGGALVTLGSLSGLPAALADAAVLPDGRVAVLSVEGERPATQVALALLPVANIAQGRLEVVTSRGIVPRLAVDPAGDRVTVTWASPVAGDQPAPLWAADRSLAR